MKRAGTLAFDLPSIFSGSESILLAARGHNHEHMYLRQISMALIFDIKQYMPVFLKPVEGSVRRDVKAIRNVLESTDFHGILILGRRFISHDMANIMYSKMKFIMPLMRNQEETDYSMHLGSSFTYRGRGILSGFSAAVDRRVYIFHDPILAGEEVSTFISLITRGIRKQSQYEEESRKFGKIAVMSNMNDDPESIYLMYKQREEIKQAFDAMKNELENDRSYLRGDESLRGYFIISFISLYMYFSILEALKEKGLSDKTSVKEAVVFRGLLDK